VESLPNHTVSVKVITVTFSPGESNISYDPAQGIGAGPIPASSSSPFSTLSLILGLSLGAILILIAVAIFLNYYFKTTKGTEDETVALLEREDK